MFLYLIIILGKYKIIKKKKFEILLDKIIAYMKKIINLP